MRTDRLTITPQRATNDQEKEIRTIEEEHPGWEAWQSLDNQWHARIVGATPPVMVHAQSARELRDRIRQYSI